MIKITRATWIGIYLVSVIGISVYFMFQLWPEKVNEESVDRNISSVELKKVDPKIHVDGTFKPDPSETLIDTLKFNLKVHVDSVSYDTAIVFLPARDKVSGDNLLWLVLIIGALAACLHGITSLAEYVGNKQFEASWTQWYLLRPVVGAVLAMLFYFVIRGGFFLKVNNKASFFAIIAMSGLIGLFSKQALYKLSELFDVLFKSDKEEKLKDKLVMDLPTIREIDPPSVTMGETNVEIAVLGTNFHRESVVRVDNEDLETRLDSSTKLFAKLDDKFLQKTGTLKVTVCNPEPHGSLSKMKELPVVAPPAESNPAP